MASTPYVTTDTVYYGTTAPAAAATTLVTALATTVFSTAKAGIWAFSSSTAAKLYRTRINQAVVDAASLKTAINAIRSQLIAIGVVS